MTIDDLFPEACRTDEFLDKPKVFGRTAEVPLDKLIGYRETLALPPTPDEELMKREDDEEFMEVFSELSSQKRHAVERVLIEGKKAYEVAMERGVTRSAILANIQGAKVEVGRKLEQRRRKERLVALSKGVEL